MTAPRHRDEPATIYLETPGLPVVMQMFSPMSRRRAPRSDVYLEMRSPGGIMFIVTWSSGLERMHADDIYVADCIFDQWGTWYLTWHGLTDQEEDRPVPTRVEVVPIDPLAQSE